MKEAAAGRVSWNPLKCHGTALREPELLAAKLLVLFVFGAGNIHWEPVVFAPFLPVLEELPAAHIGVLGQALFLLAAAALCLNRAVRAASFTLGALILFAVLASRTAYQNNALAVGFGLLLLGLQNRGQRRWMLRTQIVLIYLGAGLNKLFEADWRTGQFVDYWLREIVGAPVYLFAAEIFDPMLLARILGWAAIVSELSLAFLFMRISCTKVAVCAGLFFHSGILVLSAGSISWLFLYIMPVLYLTLQDWSVPATGDRSRLTRQPALYLGIALTYLWGVPL